jgi:DNA-directed RNA polymerase subunit RPC12/RpoP
MRRRPFSGRFVLIHPAECIATRKLSRAALSMQRMNILLDCAWCGDEVVFSVDETDDELVCSACNTRMAFAPDPATTFSLLYEPSRAA